MFGLKNEEILTCFFFIIVGYCIAKMFSRSCDGFTVVSPQGVDTCNQELNKLCGDTIDYQTCSICAGENQKDLKVAKCDETEISKYCIYPMPNKIDYTTNILDVDIKNTDSRIGLKIYNYLNQMYENIINAHALDPPSSAPYKDLPNDIINEVGFSLNNNYTRLNFINNTNSKNGIIFLQDSQQLLFPTFFQIMKGNIEEPTEKNDIRLTIHLMKETNSTPETLYLHLNENGDIKTNDTDSNIKNFRIYYYFKNN